MAIAIREIEGTWEEIVSHAREFAGQRLHLTILAPELLTSDDSRLSILQEIEARSQSMNPKPDAQDHLSAGRAGAMFGDNPCASLHSVRRKMRKRTVE